MQLEVINHKVRICGKDIYVAKALRTGEYLEFKPLRYGVVSIFGIPRAKLTKIDIYRVITQSEEENLYYIKVSARHWSLRTEGAENRLDCEIGVLLSGREVILRGRYYAKENYYFKFLLTQDFRLIELPPDGVERL